MSTVKPPHRPGRALVPVPRHTAIMLRPADLRRPTRRRLRAWLANAAKLTTILRTLTINAVVIGGIAVLIAGVWTQIKPRMLVEPVQLPSVLLKDGYKEDGVQRILAGKLESLEQTAIGTVPAPIGRNIDADTHQPDLTIPETGVSLGQIVQSLRALIKRDQYVTSEIVSSGQTLTFHVTVLDPAQHLLSDDGEAQPLDRLDALITDGAQRALKLGNPYMFASWLSAKERDDCYADPKQCGFPLSGKAYQGIVDNGPSDPFAKWALLALSKIDEDRGDFDLEAEKTKELVKADSAFSWAWYNLGVAMAELGCTGQSARAFETALRYDDKTEANYNAAGRRLLDIAARDPANAPDLLRNAVDDFAHALELKPHYQEALINLGLARFAQFAIRDPRWASESAQGIDSESAKALDDAQSTFERAVRLNEAHAARALLGLASVALAQNRNSDAEQLAQLARARSDSDPFCSQPFATTLREARGCIVSQPMKRVVTRDTMYSGFLLTGTDGRRAIPASSTLSATSASRVCAVKFPPESPLTGIAWSGVPAPLMQALP
jgi:tetratricopeptide (TPR) repeat protein